MQNDRNYSIKSAFDSLSSKTYLWGLLAVIIYTIFMVLVVAPAIDGAAGVQGYMLRLQMAFLPQNIPAPVPPEYFSWIGFDLGYAAIYGPSLAGVLLKWGGPCAKYWWMPLTDMLLNWSETSLEIFSLANGADVHAAAFFLHSCLASVKWVLLLTYGVILILSGLRVLGGRRVTV